MNLWQKYKLRLRRQRLLIRAWRKSRELRVVQDYTRNIQPNDIVILSTMRNEYARLPYFFDYYRAMGVRHFLIVDNASTDETQDYLRQQPDVSFWTTGASYKSARFGVDWLTSLQHRYCRGHWTLVVDPDELLVYPHCDTRPLPALTQWLDEQGARSFGAMLLDLYPKGPVADARCGVGENPIDTLSWFDAGNYTIEKNTQFGNLWIQGGVRTRAFFAKTPKQAPALNKTPLVKWARGYVYESSTHMILPRGLNLVYDFAGGEKPSGVLLHTKFLNIFAEKLDDENSRGQHYASSREYQAYLQQWQENPELWNRWSEQYINWRQLEILGLMSKGNWA